VKRLLLFESFRRTHNLSGIAVVINNKILLIHPRKFKSSIKKWSIPKGHVDHVNPLISALKELKEESGIELNRKYDDFVELEYNKSGFNKKLEVYIYYLKKSDVLKYISKDWIINPNIYNRNEILRAKFVNIEKAYNIVEPFMLNLLDYISDRERVIA
jgi:8-oxo-dGTP pyrophosphatase MutT (NUDIX family)